MGGIVFKPHQHRVRTPNWIDAPHLLKRCGWLPLTKLDTWLPSRQGALPAGWDSLRDFIFAIEAPQIP